MKIILLFLCIFAGFLIFLPQTPVPVVYHRPLLALFFLVCSLVTAVRTYRQGIAKNSAYLKVLAVLTPIMIAAIILFGLLYQKTKLPGRAMCKLHGSARFFVFSIYRSSRK